MAFLISESTANRQQSSVVELDTRIGNVMDKLRELKLDQNTLVFYTTDNSHDQCFDPTTNLQLVVGMSRTRAASVGSAFHSLERSFVDRLTNEQSLACVEQAGLCVFMTALRRPGPARNHDDNSVKSFFVCIHQGKRQFPA